MLPQRGVVKNAGLPAETGSLLMLTLARCIRRHGASRPTQGVIPVGGAEGIDDSYIQSQSTLPNRARPIRKSRKKASSTTQQKVGRAPLTSQDRSLGLWSQMGSSTIVYQQVPDSVVQGHSITTSNAGLQRTPLGIQGMATETAGPTTKANIDAKAISQTSQEVILGEVGVKCMPRSQVQNRVRPITRTGMQPANVIGAGLGLPSMDMRLPKPCGNGRLGKAAVGLTFQRWVEASRVQQPIAPPQGKTKMRLCVRAIPLGMRNQRA